MDALTEILQDVRLRWSFYARSEVYAPWGLAFTAADGPSFHFVVEGRGWLRLGAAQIPLQPGDLLLLPHGCEHYLADAPEGPTTPLVALPSERIGHNAALLTYPGGGVRTLLICGGVRFAGPLAHPLFDLLPNLLLLHTAEDSEQGLGYPWLDATLTMLGAEATSLRPGSNVVMTRLADMLVLQTVRAWLAQDRTQQGGWLAALRDPDIGHALVLIHRHAEQRWTVASLAAALHLSRSVFAARFSQLVGMTPMHYVTRWRMHLASNWLQEGMRVSEVAYRLGYSSAAAFSRAFKRHMGISPGAAGRWPSAEGFDTVVAPEASSQQFRVTTEDEADVL